MELTTKQLLDQSAGLRYRAEELTKMAAPNNIVLNNLQAQGNNVTNLTTQVMAKINDIVAKSQGGN